MATFKTFSAQLSHRAGYAKSNSVVVVPQDVLVVFGTENLGVVNLRLLHLVSPGIVLEGKRTGRIAIWSRNGRGFLHRQSGGRLKLVISSISGAVLYRDMQKELEPLRVGSDLLLTPREIFNGTLEAHIDESVVKEEVHLVMKSLEIRLEVVRPLLGRFLRVVLSANDLDLPFVGLPAGNLTKQLIFFRDQARRLKLRPVGFRTKESDPEPTGVSWEIQSKEAERLWKSDVLSFEKMPLHYEDRGDLKESEEVSKILDSWEDESDCRVIEVFLVRSKIPGGGGVTRDPGTGLDNVVISDLEKENERLFAHELGHVLSGVHPRQDASDGFWEADDGTVMEPTNEMGKPNPDSNSDRNRYKATNFAIDGAGCPRVLL
jgi:hypothetical protein